MFKQLALILIRDIKYEPESVGEYLFGEALFLIFKVLDR